MDFSHAVVAEIFAVRGRLVDAGAVAVLFLLSAFAYVLIRDRRNGGSNSRIAEAASEVVPGRLYGTATAKVDIWNYILMYSLWLPVITAILSVVGGLVAAELVRTALIDQFGARAAVEMGEEWIVVLQVLTLFIGSELGIYAAHYCLHKVPVLWAFHRVHHSAEALVFFTRLRDHPLDLMFLLSGAVVGRGLLSGFTLFASGTTLHPTTMSIVGVISLLMPFGPDLWRHCHIPLSFGPLNRIFNAPIMHQIHHSAEPRHFDRNLGGELMIFDWLFGTLYLPQKSESYRWGLNEYELGNKNPHVTLRGFYFEPFLYAWRRFLKPGTSSPSETTMDAPMDKSLKRPPSSV